MLGSRNYSSVLLCFTKDTQHIIDTYICLGGVAALSVFCFFGGRGLDFLAYFALFLLLAFIHSGIKAGHHFSCRCTIIFPPSYFSTLAQM